MITVIRLPKDLKVVIQEDSDARYAGGQWDRIPPGFRAKARVGNWMIATWGATEEEAIRKVLSAVESR